MHGALGECRKDGQDDGLLDAILSAVSQWNPTKSAREAKMATRAMTTSSIHNAIAEMVRRIATRFQPQKIILFGSYARGEAGPNSDVDLLVVMPPHGSKRERAVEIYGLLAGMGLAKDVIVVTPEEFEAYSDAPGTVIRTARQEGKVLYDRAA